MTPRAGAAVTPTAPAIYARISLDRTREGLGVRRQIEACRERATALGWPEPRVYSDNDISARSGKRRPGFERLLADIESGAVDGLIAWHLDRVLRRVVDLERVLDAIESHRLPIQVVFLQAGEIDLTTPSGRLLARILAAVAANEGDIKSARLSEQRAQHAHAGKAHGPLGYGYSEEQQIVPGEAAVVREVAERILDGDSLYSIAADLNARGVPTPGDGKWDARRVAKAVERGERSDLIALIGLARGSGAVSAAAFARMLNRAGATVASRAAQVREQPWAEHLASDDHGLDDATIARILRDAGIPADRSYWRAGNLRAMIRRGSLAGWREFSPGERGGRGEMVAQGAWVPILTKETVEDIRKVTDRIGVRKRGRDPKYLLAGVLKCGRCGSSLAGSPDGNRGYRYVCSTQPGRSATCGGLTVAGPQVDRLVSMAVIDTLADARVRAGTKRVGVADEAVRKAEVEITEIENLREVYAQEAAAGALKPAEWRAVRGGLDRRQREAERVLGTWAPNLRSVLSDVPHRRSEVEAWWRDTTVRRQREVVQTLIERIEIAPVGRGARRFDPERVGDPVWRV
jgi:DNA invertase Pin-like site-specific DNA recombinase